MSVSNDKRQEIYDKIKASGSREEYIISEMRRLGFWEGNGVDYKVVQEYFAKERELLGELNDLMAEKRKLDNPEQILKEIHERRKAESRIKQQETKAKREQLRKEKAERWSKLKETDIIYLGDDYSNHLSDKQSDQEKLKLNGLPLLNNAEDIAQLMGISMGELKFLSYSRKNAKTTNYHRFYIPKRTGGERLISAPLPKLKKAQHWILENVLNKLEMHDAANGCVSGRSIVTNAQKHVGKAVVINQDLKDFFPTITYERVKGMYRSLGYSGQVATILALICTEPYTINVELFGESYFSQRGKRYLPQGSPCSPAIANRIAGKLDARLTGLANKFGFEYTRYVDDLTFSGGKDQLKEIKSILHFSKKIVQEENFKLHPDKLKVMKGGGQQSVTGIVVNQKLSIDKKTLKRFRALIFQIEKDGIKGKTWNGDSENILARIDGYAKFIHQVNPEVGAKLQSRVKAILKKYNYAPINPYQKKEEVKPTKKSKPTSPQSTQPKEESGFMSKLKKWFGG